MTKKVVLLKAKFRGANGSLGFKKGLQYNLSLIQDTEITIETTTKPTLGCKYNSIYSFFDNWTDIKPR